MPRADVAERVPDAVLDRSEVRHELEVRQTVQRRRRVAAKGGRIMLSMIPTKEYFNFTFMVVCFCANCDVLSQKYCGTS